jgi:predicted RNA-binding protein with EMAP domain
MADTSQYKVGIVLSVETKKSGGKPLKACSVDVGDQDNPITVVTSASNVREGSRCVTISRMLKILHGLMLDDNKQFALVSIAD